MFRDGPKHYRTFFFAGAWSLVMVLIVMAFQLADQSVAAGVSFCIGVAGSILGLVATVMQYRLDKQQRQTE